MYNPGERSPLDNAQIVQLTRERDNFQAFVNKLPWDAYDGNAYYWRAELEHRSNQVQQAIDQWYEEHEARAARLETLHNAIPALRDAIWQALDPERAIEAERALSEAESEIRALGGRVAPTQTYAEQIGFDNSGRL